MKKLTPPNVQGLSHILSSFNVYQNQAFEPRTPAFFALELAGECGELANFEKKLWRDPTQTQHLAPLAEEAADVFISLVNYCNSRNIDLEKAIQNKLDLIETRRLAGKMGPTKAQEHKES